MVKRNSENNLPPPIIQKVAELISYDHKNNIIEFRCPVCKNVYSCQDPEMWTVFKCKNCTNVELVVYSHKKYMDLEKEKKEKAKRIKNAIIPFLASGLTVLIVYFLELKVNGYPPFDLSIWIWFIIFGGFLFGFAHVIMND